MTYKLALNSKEIHEYIGNHKLLALDIETSPIEKYRSDDKASLDAHKSSITGISFSVVEGTGIYVPFNHKVGRNADFVGTFEWIKNNILLNKKQMTLKTHTEFRKLNDCGLKKLVSELLKVELPTFESVTEGRFFDELNSEDTETALQKANR